MNRLCLNSFKKLDIFGSEITLNYNKDNLFRTPFGGFVAIVCVFTLVVLFFSNIYSFQHQISTLIGKTQVSFVSSTEYDPDPDVLEVGSNKMMIAVKFDQTNFIHRPQINVTFEQRHYITYDNGTYVQKKIPMPLEPCTIDHFYDLPNYNINWTVSFDQSGLSDYLCLKKGETFQIGGIYESKEFSHLKFTFKKCVNYTNPIESWKPVCDTLENISQLDEDSRIKFLFSNTLIKPESPSNPIQTYLDSILFNVQPQKMYTTANILLNEQTIKTDESVTLFEDINTKKFVSYKQRDIVSQVAVGNFTNYSEIFFLRSNFSTLISRSFLKIDEVISYMGGFCQVFLLVSAIIGKDYLQFFQDINIIIFVFQLTVSQFNEYIYNIELANKLYDFDIKTQSKESRQSNRRSPSSSTRFDLRLGFSTNTPKGQDNKGAEFSSRLNQQTNSPKNTDLKSLQFSKFPKNQIKRVIQNQKANNSIGNKENLIENQEIQLQQEQLRNQVQNDSHINKRNNEDLPTTKRLDSFRPFSPQSVESKANLFSKQNSQNLVTQQYIDLNTERNEIKQNQLTDIQIDLNQIKQENEIIDIDQITIAKSNNQFQNAKTIRNTSLQQFDKFFSRQNFKTASSLSKPTQFEVQSEGNLNKKNQENEQNLTLTNGIQQFPKQKTIVDNKQFLDQELKKIIQRDRSLWLNTKYFINKITCGKMYNTHQVQLLNKAIELVKQDLDIFMILDRQKEIEKFKKLFFSQDQQVLFNFFPKPLITIDKEEIQLSRQSLKPHLAKNNNSLDLKRNQTKKLNIQLKNIGLISKAVLRFKQNLKGSKLSDYQQLFNCYENILQNSNSEVDKEVNKKLVEHLGQEMKNIFEIAYLQFYFSLLKTIYLNILIMHRMKQRKDQKMLNSSQRQNQIQFLQNLQSNDNNPSQFKIQIQQRDGNMEYEEYVEDNTPNNNNHTSNKQNASLEIKEIFLGQNKYQSQFKDNTILEDQSEKEKESKQGEADNNLVQFEQEDYDYESQSGSNNKNNNNDFMKQQQKIEQCGITVLNNQFNDQPNIN